VITRRLQEAEDMQRPSPASPVAGHQ